MTFVEACDFMASGGIVESCRGRRFTGRNGQLFMLGPGGKYIFGFGLLEDEVTGAWQAVDS